MSQSSGRSCCSNYRFLLTLGGNKTKHNRNRILDLLRKYLPCSLHSRLFYTPRYLNKNTLIRNPTSSVPSCLLGLNWQGRNFIFYYLNWNKENRAIVRIQLEASWISFWKLTWSFTTAIFMVGINQPNKINCEVPDGWQGWTF